MTRFSLLPASVAQSATADTTGYSDSENGVSVLRKRPASIFIGAAVSAGLIITGMLASDGAQARMVYAPNGVTRVDSRHALVYRGQQYCWYQSAWHGSGWYWCGYAWHRGYGWSGAYGWNYWHGAHIMPYPGWYRGRDAMSGRPAPLKKADQNGQEPAGSNPASGSASSATGGNDR
ncbi:MAG: hypothetical protein ABSD74_17635 [Rhizomicrobium sp.]|jgi:hypothetical protein